MLMAYYRIIKNGKATKLKSEISNPFWGIIFRHLSKKNIYAQFFKTRELFRISILFNVLETGC